MGKNKTGKRADIISDIKDNFLNDTNYDLDNVKKDLGLVKNFRFSIKTSELYDYVNWIIAIYFLIAVVALVPIVYKLLPISKPAGMIVLSIWAIHTMSVAGILPSWNRWAEWNGRYRDDMRSFLKGDDGMAGNAITRITGSRDLYSPESRGHKASVNFLTCHDGFTLYDLYSYNEKHNDKNGWNNTDGDNNGHSWNCGAEGETDDPNVNGLRRRLIKNAFAALLCSRGPAMFFAGDEFCNTQFGNNNAYCQDNIISWLDWGRLEEFKEIHDFVRHMIQFRKEHPILRKMTKPSSCQFPEISVHNGTPFNASTDYKTKLIGIMYAGRNEEDTEDDIVFYCMNAYWEPLVMQLPVLPNGKHWHVDTNTNAEYFDGEDFTEKTELLGVNTIRVPARTTIILVAE